MGYTKDARVDSYIDASPDWQQATCREVRDIVHRPMRMSSRRSSSGIARISCSEATSELCWRRSTRNVFLYDGAIVPEPEGTITGGHENKTARQISIHEGEGINAPALKAIFEQTIANNRAGEWRKIRWGRVRNEGDPGRPLTGVRRRRDELLPCFRPRHRRPAVEDEVVFLVARPHADLVAIGIDGDRRRARAREHQGPRR